MSFKQYFCALGLPALLSLNGCAPDEKGYSEHLDSVNHKIESGVYDDASSMQMSDDDVISSAAIDIDVNCNAASLCTYSTTVFQDMSLEACLGLGQKMLGYVYHDPKAGTFHPVSGATTDAEHDLVDRASLKLAAPGLFADAPDLTLLYTDNNRVECHAQDDLVGTFNSYLFVDHPDARLMYGTGALSHNDDTAFTSVHSYRVTQDQPPYSLAID